MIEQGIRVVPAVVALVTATGSGTQVIGVMIIGKTKASSSNAETVLALVVSITVTSHAPHQTIRNVVVTNGPAITTPCSALTAATLL